MSSLLVPTSITIPDNSAPANLAALCQRCHMLNDAAEHRWQRWWNAFRRRALRDLYEDPRLTPRAAIRAAIATSDLPRSVYDIRVLSPDELHSFVDDALVCLLRHRC